MSEEQSVPFPLGTFEGAIVTDDGQSGLFKFSLGDGQDQIFSIPQDQLMPLMAGISQVSGDSARILQQDSAVKHALPAEWWSFAFSSDKTQLLLSFRLPGGMELTFQFARDRLPMMRETLQAMEGQQSTLPPAGTSRQ
jgi:hypothetical protein